MRRPDETEERGDERAWSLLESSGSCVKRMTGDHFRVDGEKMGEKIKVGTMTSSRLGELTATAGR